MSQQQHTQEPVAWRITFRFGNEPDGLLSVHYHGTNPIADYRQVDPDAKSEPLFLKTDIAAHVAELEKQRDMLLAALEKQQLDTVCECKNCMNAHAAIASVKGGAA